METIKKFPDAPGVYLFYNSKNVLIYVGKATSLHDRVRSYWRTPRSQRPIEQMIHEVINVKYQQTDSVLEAIILEGNLIKKFRPKYNIDWRDDKSWNYIVITDDKYPQIKTVREHELKSVIASEAKQSPRHKIATSPTVPRNDKYRYVFGPYPGLNTAAMLKILRRLFVYSTCKPLQGKPCLYYQMGQCLGVCTGEITTLEYRSKVIEPMIMFLRGQKKSLLRKLNTKLVQESKLENFEEAARLRDQIKALQRIHDVALLNKKMIVDVLPASRKILIEGYDISNLGESDKVGSLVVFNEHGPVKSQYKKFNIYRVIGQSDVDCLAEVLERRLKHQEWPLPHIFLVDGGKPQVNRARKILNEFKNYLPIVGIAKGVGRKRNDFFISAFKKDQNLVQWINNHRVLLIQVRDEAHRFAIVFSRSKRKIK